VKVAHIEHSRADIGVVL